MELTKTFTLPNGVLTPEGLQKTVVVREMTGEDEERLGALKDVNQLYTELFSGLVESLGGKPMTRELASQVVMGDADFLMVAIRQTSFGKDLSMEANCPKCNERLKLTVDLAELPTKPQGKAVNGNQTVTGKLPRSGKEIVISLPTVESQEKVLPLAKRNAAKATTAFLTIITKRLGPVNAPETLSEDVFRKMSKVDRDYIGGLIKEQMGGVDLDIDVTCHACQGEFSAPVDMSNFFSTATTN